MAGSASVTIGVIDTGIDASHPDLRGRVDLQLAFGSATALDGNGHGTHTAGTIGAASNNGGGVSGTDWKVRNCVIPHLAAARGVQDLIAPNVVGIVVVISR